jgi:hypothetical protein
VTATDMSEILFSIYSFRCSSITSAGVFNYNRADYDYEAQSDNPGDSFLTMEHMDITATVTAIDEYQMLLHNYHSKLEM